MARQIIKQPNGLLAEYSSIMDAFVIVDATAEDLIENAAREAAEDARRRYIDAIEKAERGVIRKPFGLEWKEALENHNHNSAPEDRIESNVTDQGRASTAPPRNQEKHDGN